MLGFHNRGKVCRVHFDALPLVESQIPVSKLCQQGPLQDLFGRLVLDEVDDDVLQPVVILRSHVFLGKSQEAGVLQLYSLARHRAKQMTDYSESTIHCLLALRT